MGNLGATRRLDALFVGAFEKKRGAPLKLYVFMNPCVQIYFL
jgi:hypothetical protein